MIKLCLICRRAADKRRQIGDGRQAAADKRRQIGGPSAVTPVRGSRSPRPPRTQIIITHTIIVNYNNRSHFSDEVLSVSGGQTCAHAHAHAHARTHAHAHAHTHTHTRTRARTHAHTRAHARTHTRLQAKPEDRPMPATVDSQHPRGDGKSLDIGALEKH